MLYRQLRLHNVAEASETPGLSGIQLSRYPAEIRNVMGERGRFVGAESIGCEIRFVTNASRVQLALSCFRPEFAPEQEIRVYRGGFPLPRALYRLDSERSVLLPGKVNTLFLSPFPFLEGFGDNVPSSCGFFSNVWRIAFGCGVGILCGIDAFGGEIRPPFPHETPSIRYIAYGSSITHATMDGYPMIAARRLGWDVLNLGLSGACVAEPQVADWLAGRDDWDVMTLEVGINMIKGTS